MQRTSTASACASTSSGTPTPATRSTSCPGAEARGRTLPIDPWVVEALDAFLARARRRGRRRRRGRARRAARRARRGARGDPRARARRPASRSPEVAARARRRAAAVPVGGRALRARRAARVPRRRAGARQDRRGARRARGRRRLPGDRRLPGVAEAQLGARGRAAGCRTASVAVVEGRVRRPADRRDHDPQLRDRRRAPRGARPPAAARARRRRVALRQEPAGQAHAGGAPARRRRRRRRAAPRADRHAGAQPRRGARRAAARHRPPRGLRLGRALRAPVPRRAVRGAPALAPAPALLRAPAEVRGAAPAAGQAPGRRAGRARQRARVPPRRGGRHRLAARAAAGPRASSTRRSPRRCAPSAWRSSARCSGWPRAASSAPRWRGSHDFLASGEPLVVFARHVEVQEAVLERFPDARAPARPRLGRRARGRPSAPSRTPTARSCIVCATRVAAPGHHAHARVERRVPRARVDARDARPGRGPLPPHRPARRRDRLVPARRRHDRRDDGRAHPAQARRSSPPSPTGAASTATASSTAVVRELRDGQPFRHLRPVV